MFPRRTVVTSHGKRYEYVHLVESYRRPGDGRPMHRVVANLGVLSDQAFENLKLTFEASRSGKRVAVVSAKPANTRHSKPDANLRYLDIAVVYELWRQWGLDRILEDLIPAGESEVSAAKVVEALTVQRLLDPNSKLAAVRWFPHTVLPELLRVEEHQFNNTRIHRVLDELESVTPALMAKLPRLYRERDGAFVTMFMDVSDASFVGHGPDLAAVCKTKVGVIQPKVGVVLLCNEKGYPLRWDVIAGNRSDGVAMTDMLQSIAGLDWARNTPVVLDRAMGRTAYIRSMLATKLQFLTAVTRTEFGTYAPKLPWTETQDLSLEDAGSGKLASKAAARLVAAGMEKVDEDLLVLDFGVVEPIGADADELLQTLVAGEQDANARAMHIARFIQQAIADDRYISLAAAGTALGLKKGVAKKYCRLLQLPDDVQNAIIDGKSAAWPLVRLLDITTIDGPDAQRVAFDALMDSTPPRRRAAGSQPHRPLKEKKDPEALRVRVVSFFNPEQFVGQRDNAQKRLDSIDKFVTELNRKLANPNANQDADKIKAAIAQRLSRDDLLSVYEITVEQHNIGDRCCRQVKVALDADEWQKRRRYDGFSVLVGHPELPHTADRLCRLYREKDTVEKDFWVMKSIVEMLPVRHRTNLKVKAHVTLCVLSLLLERTLRAKLLGKYTVGQALEALKRCYLNLYRNEDRPSVYTITHIDKEQRGILRKLRLTHLADDDHLAARISPR